MVDDTLYPLIQAQQAALETIVTGDTYSSSIGQRVSLTWPSEQDPADQIYLGRVDLESSSNSDRVAMTTEWRAVIVEPPQYLLLWALQVQTEMVHALRTICGIHIERRSIPDREPGSNTLEIAVTVTAWASEPE